MRALVAGIGDVFRGDDGFGCSVVRALAGRRLAGGGNVVDVIDFGLRGLELVYALCQGYGLAVLVDTAELGGVPGDLFLIEPELDGACPDAVPAASLLTHGVNPVRVLRSVAALGCRPPRVLLLACQPDRPAGDGGRVGLSTAVAAAVAPAAAEVEAAIEAALRSKPFPARQSARLAI
jgi:hydrogenase maturation protease